MVHASKTTFSSSSETRESLGILKTLSSRLAVNNLRNCVTLASFSGNSDTEIKRKWNVSLHSRQPLLFFISQKDSSCRKKGNSLENHLTLLFISSSEDPMTSWWTTRQETLRGLELWVSESSVNLKGKHARSESISNWQTRDNQTLAKQQELFGVQRKC